MFTKILVPLDGTEVAEHALAPAIDLAKKYKGTLILLCTCTTGFGSDSLQNLTNDHNWFWTTPSDDPIYQEGKNYLARLIRDLAESGLEIQSLLVQGDEAGAIIGISEAQDINLIVMTKHCQSEPRHNLLGDITERVLHHTSCPVMVICSNLLNGLVDNSCDDPNQLANETGPIQV